jgi:hypothetical protein
MSYHLDQRATDCIAHMAGKESKRKCPAGGVVAWCTCAEICRRMTA